MTAGRPTVTHQFFEWHGGTDEDQAELASWSDARAADMGPLLARFRGGVHARLWGKGALLAVDLGLAFGVLRALVGSPEDLARDVVAIFLAATVLVGMALVLLLLAARRRRHEVRSGGLVLRATADAPAAAVPWASVDPGRAFIAPSTATATGRVASFLQRAVRPPAVVVNGSVRGADGPDGANAVLRHGRVGEGSFGWWQIGVGDPVAVLTAMETAMVAEGYPAEGMASRALFRESTLRAMGRDAARVLDRTLADPVIGVSPAGARSRGADPAHSWRDHRPT
ncbi:hypothetical protein [Janibacter cremeus]|uniref:Uncharacterized protein n=1 Tax=Janibacter cremeus TaxID=1285192 RepID=A0A852W0A7_9MICO|nr:hypothetical protein [Janibacter cremeus]NYF99415.1 hypothetical protein [Janibacter cremeus]